MNALFKRHHVLGIAAATLLIGCSGGESGTGIQANNQTTVGQITGFGSVYVNGVKFNTNQATVFIDGVQAAESNLSVGMVVTVVGSVNDDGVYGTANTVSAKTEVEGLVFENNIVGGIGNINVMGQVVNISNDTKFKSEVTGIVVIDDLVADSSVVEVSGYSDGQGKIYATYVKAVSSGGTSAAEVKLHGIVKNLSGDAASGSFNIGNSTIQVNYDGSTIFKDMLRGELANDIYVSIESSNYSGGVVLASIIEKEDPSNEGTGTDMEFEGVVTNTANIASNEFSVNGRIVRFDAGTTFDGGDQNNIQLEVKLEVDGKVQADNSILADKISFRMESNMEIEGSVVNVGNNMLTIDNTIVVVNAFTRYEDETDEHNRTFNFTDIMSGMMIEAKFYVDPESGNNIATSIERVM
ncbi:DUF5666 domain-containing protein [Kaarinaea lacus]